MQKKLKVLRKNLQDERAESIKQITETTPIYNGIILDKSVNTLIREIDAKVCKK